MDYFTDLLSAFLWAFNFLILPAIVYGSTLALGALGVTLVFGILRFANFAHGDIMAFGAMIALICTETINRFAIFTYPIPSGIIFLPIAMLATGFLAVILDRTVYRYYRSIKSPPVVMVMASIGILFLLNGITRLIKGPGLQAFNAKKTFGIDEVNTSSLIEKLGERAVQIKTEFSTGNQVVHVTEPELILFTVADFKRATGLPEGFGLDLIQILIIFFAIVFFITLYWFLKYTKLGKAMRAFSDNEDLALISGIDPSKIVTTMWLIAGALAAVAGTLYGLDKGYKPFTYFQMVLPIFAAAIVGGIGKPQGAIVGGYLVAFTEIFITANYKKIVNYILPESLEVTGNLQLIGTEYKFSVSFIILVIVLLYRPSGIFRGRVI